MTRRLFFGAAAGACVPSESLVLEALAAERMPHRIVVHGVAPSPFFEVRDYGAAGPGVARVLNRRGIRAVWAQDGRLLFPFESLEARERAWREVAADPEWISLRKNAVLSQIAVYQPFHAKAQRRQE